MSLLGVWLPSGKCFDIEFLSSRKQAFITIDELSETIVAVAELEHTDVLRKIKSLNYLESV